METAASFEARKAPSSYPTILGEAMETKPGSAKYLSNRECLLSHHDSRSPTGSP
jgi:hypothetical protein